MSRLRRRFSLAMPVLVLAAVIAVLVLTGGERVTYAQSGTTTIDTGAGTQHIGPGLWGILYDHDAGEETPDELEVDIGQDTSVEVGVDLSEQITSAGGSHVSGDSWLIPTGSVLAVIQRADVVYAALTPTAGSEGPSGQVDKYARMNAVLKKVVKAHEAGVPAIEAASQALFAKEDKLAVEITTSSATTETAVRTWLIAEGVNVGPSGTEGGTHRSIVGMIPVGKVLPLSKRFTTVYLRAEGYDGEGAPLSRSRWPQYAKDYENSVTALLSTAQTSGDSQTEGSDESSSENEGPSGQVLQPPVSVTCPTSTVTIPRGWEGDLVRRLEAINADDWHDACALGAGVKVGIIDWGFAGLDDDPGLVNLSIYDPTTNPNGNAYCQPVGEGTWPQGGVMQRLSEPCEPSFRAFIIGNTVRHGVNIAELVKDVAPSAQLFYAQANSPRQVYRAARWLVNTKNVDVIVHAAGWTYDGRGNGESPLGIVFYSDDPGDTSETDEHSSYRYYPSPLNTVDVFVRDTSGPVWINAAGNQEEHTLRVTSPNVLGGTTDYSDFLVLNPNATGTGLVLAQDKTCQIVPKENFAIYTFSMRWGDNWNSPTRSLDFFISPKTTHPTTSWVGAWVNTATGQEQLPGRYPVRRAVKDSIFGSDVMCLRIRVNSNSSGRIIVPTWVQFQILTTKYETPVIWNTGADGEGHSIVNPASSDNPGLIAVGAMDMRAAYDDDPETVDPSLKSYSSRGPVYASTDDVVTATPMRVKPDISAPSGAATHTKWDHECNENAQTCGEELYFGGTSAATGHVGGLAALVVELYKDIGVAYTPKDIADYLKLATRGIKSGISYPNDNWGHGFAELPCRSEDVTFPSASVSTDSWSADDCTSSRRSGRYADYYSFYVSEETDLEITLSSVTDTFLYLLEGAYTGGNDFTRYNDDYPGLINIYDSRIKETVDPGVYTVVATTFAPSNIGSYTLTIDEECIGTTCQDAFVTPAASISPSPAGATIRSDGVWHRFNLSTNVPVKVVVNPTGTTPRLEINRTEPSYSYCPPEPDDPVSYGADGEIYLAGCYPGSGTVEIRKVSDNSLLRSYVVNITAPPVVMPSPPTWDASLSPSPGSAGILNNGAWHAFTITSGGPVRVKVNPSITPGIVNPPTAPRLEITTSSSEGNLCDAEMDDPATVSNGGTVYLAGCASGLSYVELRRETDNSHVRTYAVMVGTYTPPATCAPVTGFAATRLSGSSVYISWINPSGGLAATGRQVGVQKLVGGAWLHERVINEPSTGTSSWHLLIDANFNYAYRVRSVCGFSYSTYAGWATVAPWAGGSSGPGGQVGPPSPTPVPAQGQSYVAPKKGEGEIPPLPPVN